jgi:hypothetical protein
MYIERLQRSVGVQNGGGKPLFRPGGNFAFSVRRSGSQISLDGSSELEVGFLLGVQ